MKNNFLKIKKYYNIFCNNKKKELPTTLTEETFHVFTLSVCACRGIFLASQ